MSQLVVVVGLIAIILLHELGHLITARLAGIRATAYSFGFGPVLWQRHWRGIDWKISAIPLGGYVRIPAVMPPDVDSDRARASRDWQLTDANSARIAAASTSQQLYEVMGQVTPTVEAEKWDRLRDEHAPDTYYLATWPRRTLVILAGSAVNIIGGAFVLWMTLWLFSPLYKTQWQITQVAGKTPASLVGSHVLQLNGEGLTYSDGRRVKNLDKQARAHPGKSLLLLADGSVVYVAPGGATLSNKRLDFAGRRKDVSASSALHGSLETTRMLATSTLQIATKVFVDEKTRRQTGTVIGAVDKAPEARDFLPQYIAIISIAIGLVNLLPLLPLDGGHFVMSTLRALRLPLHRTAYVVYGVAGFAFVMALFAIGLANDIRAF